MVNLGNGIDCYRTWEALLFGSIPIVWNSTLWPMYKRFPVLVLNNYDRINGNRKRLMQFKAKTYDRSILLAQHWFDRIDAWRPKSYFDMKKEQIKTYQ